MRSVMRLIVLGAWSLAWAAAFGLRRRRAEELEELMRLMAARRHGEVDFIEQHFLAAQAAGRILRHHDL